MIEAACSGGTTDIVATPHANSDYEFRPVEAEGLRRKLQDTFRDRIRIHLGCDLHLGLEEVERAIADPAHFSLNGTGYVLVEPPEPMSAKTIFEACKRMLAAGLRPIVTHPERYGSWQGRDREYERWAAEGIRMQVTGGSLLGHFGSAARRAGEKMVANGWAHFLASDAHNTRGRTPDLSAVHSLVADRWGAAAAMQLLEYNPAAAIAGEPVRPIVPRASRMAFLRALTKVPPPVRR